MHKILLVYTRNWKFHTDTNGIIFISGILKNKTDVKEKPNTHEEPTIESTEESLSEATQDTVVDMTSEKLEQMARENEELRDKYLRLHAEFDNFRKRTLKEKMDMMRTASQDIMMALLPVLDDFERAKKTADAADSTEQFSEGVNLVYHKLFATLKGKGLEPMEAAGEAFDPELHEAVTEIPAPTEDLKGKVVDAIEKGYKLGDKIIRHAKVVVGK